MLKLRPSLNIGGIDCPPEIEDRLNRWYEEVHIPMAVKVGKIKSMTRGRMVESRHTISGSGLPQYISILEFDSKQDYDEYFAHPLHEELSKEMHETWPNWEQMRKFRAQYEVITRWP